MTRILTAAVLLPIVLGIVWYLPPIATVVLVGIVTLIAFVEYAGLARRLSPEFPTTVSAVVTLATYSALVLPMPLELVLALVTILLCGWAVVQVSPQQDVLRAVAVAALPALYLGVPLGMAAAIRARWGAALLILPFLAIVVSDSAQYFGGRAFGRRPLAPDISPKKTVEGAVCGVAATVIALPLLGQPLCPGVGGPMFAGFAVFLAAAGIAGDLFESMLKRSAGVKDSSALIPGHGGMLDRIDALLFAFPVFYLFLFYWVATPAAPGAAP